MFSLLTKQQKNKMIKKEKLHLLLFNKTLSTEMKYNTIFMDDTCTYVYNYDIKYNVEFFVQ